MSPPHPSPPPRGRPASRAVACGDARRRSTPLCSFLSLFLSPSAEIAASLPPGLLSRRRDSAFLSVFLSPPRSCHRCSSERGGAPPPCPTDLLPPLLGRHCRGIHRHSSLFGYVAAAAVIPSDKVVVAVRSVGLSNGEPKLAAGSPADSPPPVIL
ncbi:uncharacterized protein LOC125192038 isoform X2 [Salvia hispanica]|uniref:uncharacterized protein LOC125192038 isoform X2 n=1 Tax=Salvia hispanica TaxID=49212 RepID=UPI0020098AF7|nr:uncharacterized protein LOC125192038 isoform X2 [Salvia hispanica]